MFLTPSDSGNTVNKEQHHLALKELEVLCEKVHSEQAINVLSELGNKMATNKIRRV